jgi:hypothetical protein
MVDVNTQSDGRTSRGATYRKSKCLPKNRKVGKRLASLKARLYVRQLEGPHSAGAERQR